MTHLSPLIALLLAFVLTRALVRLAPGLGFVDSPNARSMHVRPVATIGGAGLVLAVLGTIGVGYVLGWNPDPLSGWLAAVGALLLVLVLDERAAMHWTTKLAVQALASLLLVLGAEGLLPLSFGGGVASGVAAAAVLVYVQNLYNFMDGLDGLSGLEGCVVGVGQYFVYAPVDPQLACLSLTLAAASLGFVCWNLPPARIFMGDVGAHFLGVAFAWVAVVGERSGVPLAIGLMPLGAFLVDGTYTLARRAVRGENITEAHRFHLYQRLHLSGWPPAMVDGLYVLWSGLFCWMALRARSERLGFPLTALMIAMSVAVAALVEVRWRRTRKDV